MQMSDGMPHIEGTARQARLEMFAPFVSVLPWFTPDVLNKLYLNFFPNADNPDDHTFASRSLTCADVLQSPHIRRLMADVYVMEDDLQNVLREQVQLDTATHTRLGYFIRAYQAECRKHFPGVAYIESYKVGADMILNPEASADEIFNSIARRLNRANSLETQQKSVGYFLNLLDKKDIPERYSEFVNYLKGLQDYQPDNEELPDALKSISDATKVQGTSVVVKIPARVREKILSGFEVTSRRTTPITLHALLVGINKYTTKNVLPLRGCINDVRSIEVYLRSNIHADRKLQITTVLDEKATQHNIMEAVYEMQRNVEPGDTVLFYFAGYGGRAESGQPDGLNYLLAHDTESMGIELGHLFNALSNIPDDCNQVIMLDCSFRRQSTRKDIWIRSLPWTIQAEMNAPEYTQLSGHNNRVLIYAGGLDGDAHEDLEQGLFTKSLLDAMVRNDNSCTYSQLGDLKNAMVSYAVEQQPGIITSGALRPDTLFLDGYLKKRPQYRTTFLVEPGGEAATLLEGYKAYNKEYNYQFDLIEEGHNAPYRVKWLPNEVWICENDEAQRPVCAQMIDVHFAYNVLTDMAQISRWETLKQMPDAGFSASTDLEVELIKFGSGGEQQSLDIFKNLCSFDFSTSRNRPDLLKVRLTNRSKQPLYCAVAYLSNQYGIHTDLLPRDVRLDVGQSVESTVDRAISLAADTFIDEYNYQFSDCYIKVFADPERPVDLSQYNQQPLRRPSMRNQRESSSSGEAEQIRSRRSKTQSPDDLMGEE